MWSVLLLGLLLGMRHALEADHLAAVASLSTGGGSRASIVLRGATWGFGHTVALLAAGVSSIALGLAVPAGPWLERGVGVMLALLGTNVLVRLRRDRVHVHTHRHAGGIVHLHVHRHGGDDVDSTDHRHAHRLDLRAMGVGMVHGLAGSAALLLVIASGLTSPWLGLAYVAVFGVGSIAGMTALSAVIALPLDASARRLARAYTSVELLIAVGTIALGLAMLR
jgi:cytochrome c biogenesis protein CcdA